MISETSSVYTAFGMMINSGAGPYVHVGERRCVATPRFVPGRSIVMEKFSDQQNVNATKFLRDYLSGWVEGDQVRHIRSRFTAEELEGECLQIARSHLSEK